jgi:iron complex transport system permease protein
LLKNRSILYLALITLLFVVAILHLFSGQISIAFSDYLNALWNYDPNDTEQIIVRELRFPRMVAATIAGSGLAISGMLMQTLFNNPLAGPYVLGINSGSSLFVALSMFTGFSFFQTNLGIVGAALTGAFISGIIILFFSFKLRSTVSLLLIGLMLGGFTSSIVGILEMHSGAQDLKSFTLWSMGSLQHVTNSQLPFILSFFLVSTSLLIFIIKPLNAMVLGEKAAENLGVNINRFRLICIGITAMYAGLITAFCGPIAFVGLAIPNLTRIVFKTQNHNHLILANFIIGSTFLLIIDSGIQLMEPIIALPLNAVTSLIGAPFIIYIVIKKLK